MTADPPPQGGTVFTAQKSLFLIVGIFGFFANLLMLTAPIFALQVYDRVLSSRSVETLTALMLLAAFLFTVMGFLDYARKRIAARIGERVASALAPAAFHAALSSTGATADKRLHLHDLDNIRRFFASSAFTALYDLAWVPVFLLAIALFHPWLGVIALLGAAVLIYPIFRQYFGSSFENLPADKNTPASVVPIETVLHNAALVTVLGMRSALLNRWKNTERRKRQHLVRRQDQQTALSTTIQTFRIFLQSAMIGAGAYLVLQGQLTPGAIIASTVLLARALGSLDTLGQNCPILFSGLSACRRATRLGQIPETTSTVSLDRLKSGVSLRHVSVFPPDTQRAALRMISFNLEAGQALGVIGLTGSGKSALARILTGVWPLSSGEVHFGGAALRGISPEAQMQHIGYLPQDTRLFDGTIAENIARFSDKIEDRRIIQSAELAAAHDPIIDLPDGYETRISAGNITIPAGLVQRIALARAIINDPQLLIFDEPATNLDDVGMRALHEIVRQAKSNGHSVIILTQRVAAVQECDLILALDNGVQKAFGPRDTILHGAITSVASLRSAPLQGAAS
ncbi:MAG: type I secretion system permease/ATPase [Paracoccaceae bacterium]